MFTTEGSAEDDWRFTIDVNRGEVRIDEYFGFHYDGVAEGFAALWGAQPEECPDGNAVDIPEGQIAFHSTRDGNTDSYLMNTDGSDPMRTTDDPQVDYGPSCSSDGEQIMFVSLGDGKSEIYVMNADGSDEFRLTYDEEMEYYPAWSPNGKYILFASQRDGKNEVYIIRPDDSDERRITDNPASDIGGNWNPTAEKSSLPPIETATPKSIWWTLINRSISDTSI